MQDKFAADVALLRNAEYAIAEKVEILHSFCEVAGYGQHIDDFVAAGGIDILVHISTAEWPSDGDLRESCSLYDKSALLKESRVHDQATQRPFGSPCHPQTYHSMRRVAIGCLGEMCNYKQYGLAMEREGLFTSFPKMLRDTGAVYRYGQSYDDMYGVKGARNPDHAQFILERLVSIMAGTLSKIPSRPLYNLLCERCIPAVAPLIDVREYERRPRQRGDQVDPLLESFPRCVYNMLGVTSVHPLSRAARAVLFKIDLTAKVRALPPHQNGMGMKESCYVRLQRLYEAHLEEQHLPVICQHMQATALVAGAISDAGNTHFVEGEYRAALAQYRAALAGSTWCGEAAAGMSACFLRLGKPKKALDAALLAVQHNPRWARGWGRLGEVLHALGDPQKARTCLDLGRQLDPASAREFNLDALNGPPAAPRSHSNRPAVAEMYHGLVLLARGRDKLAQGVRSVRRHWTVSVATFAILGVCVGEPMFILSLSSAEEDQEGEMMDQEHCEGEPSPELVLCLLQRAMAFRKMYKPSSILVAFRLAYAWPLLKRFGQQVGVEVSLETHADAMCSAATHDTDYLGFNGEAVGRAKYMPLMVDV